MKNKKILFIPLFLIIITSMVLAAGQQKTARQKQSRLPVMKPTGSLKIKFFKAYKETRSSRSLVQQRGLPTSGRSLTIRAGDDVVLTWRIDACKLEEVTFVRISGFRSATSPGDVTILSRDCKSYTRRLPLNKDPLETTTYTLSVEVKDKASGIPLKAQKSFKVIVLKPKITALKPVLFRSSRKVSLMIKNTGDTYFKGAVFGEIVIRKRIGTTYNPHHTGSRPRERYSTYKNEKYRKPLHGTMTMGRNQQFKIAEYILPASAWEPGIVEFTIKVKTSPRGYGEGKIFRISM